VECQVGEGGRLKEQAEGCRSRLSLQKMCVRLFAETYANLGPSTGSARETYANLGWTGMGRVKSTPIWDRHERGEGTNFLIQLLITH